MINKDLIQRRIELEKSFKDLKLKLDQKETVEYFNYKKTPEGAKDRSAKDKIIDQLKMDDDNWLMEEVELVNIQTELSSIKMIMEVLLTTLNRQDLPFENFVEYQDNLLTDLGIV